MALIYGLNQQLITWYPVGSLTKEEIRGGFMESEGYHRPAKHIIESQKWHNEDTRISRPYHIPTKLRKIQNCSAAPSQGKRDTVSPQKKDNS